MKKSNQTILSVFNASNIRVGVVVSRFNQDISDKLLDGVMATAKAYSLDPKKIKVLSVIGSVEIPVVLQKLAATKKYDCLVALGSVIQGETKHFDYVSKIVSEGVLRVMLDYGLPIGFGVLTVNNPAQAKARLDAGGQALAASLHAVTTMKEI